MNAIALAEAASSPSALTDKRCGTCKHWRPRPKRDASADRHFGACKAPLPKKIPVCFDRSIGDRWETSSHIGDNCPAWKAGGKHGALK